MQVGTNLFPLEYLDALGIPEGESVDLHFTFASTRARAAHPPKLEVTFSASESATLCARLNSAATVDLLVLGSRCCTVATAGPASCTRWGALWTCTAVTSAPSPGTKHDGRMRGFLRYTCARALPCTDFARLQPKGNTLRHSSVMCFWSAAADARHPAWQRSLGSRL